MLSVALKPQGRKALTNFPTHMCCAMFVRARNAQSIRVQHPKIQGWVRQYARLLRNQTGQLDRYRVNEKGLIYVALCVLGTRHVSSAVSFDILRRDVPSPTRVLLKVVGKCIKVIAKPLG